MDETHIHFHFGGNVITAAPKPTVLYVGINKSAYSGYNAIRYSSNGINWSNIKSGGFGDWIDYNYNYNNYPNQIAYGSNMWVVVGTNGYECGI